MKRGATLFLRAVLVLSGTGALALLLWEPHIEGRNAHATPFAIYFEDPFLAYAYIASIPFFVGLYQAFKVLGYAGRNKEFSPSAARSLRTIKYCAIAIIGFVAVGEVFIMWAIVKIARVAFLLASSSLSPRFWSPRRWPFSNESCGTLWALSQRMT